MVMSLRNDYRIACIPNTISSLLLQLRGTQQNEHLKNERTN